MLRPPMYAAGLNSADPRARLFAAAGPPRFGGAMEAAAAQVGAPHGFPADLDAVAAQLPPMGAETVTAAVSALFPDMSHRAAGAVGALLQTEGASNRADVLLMLRTRGGEAMLQRAATIEHPLSVLNLGELEQAVLRANPPAIWPGCGWPTGGTPFAPPGAPTQGTSQGQVPAPLDSATADFGQLRPYLDEAGLGEPTEEGIPRQGMLDNAVAAAARHTIPFLPAISPGQLPRGWAERPLASWLLDTVRHFWSTTVTGVAGTGDCFNRLSHVACVALDVRYPAAVAERAAVRYDAARYHGVCMSALKARSGEQVREAYRETCEIFNENSADRRLEEETSRGLGAQGTPGASRGASATGSRPSAGQASDVRAAVGAGARFCLLYGLGKCSKTEAACGITHMCPYCGGEAKGCLSQNHGGSIKRHFGAALAEASRPGRGGGRSGQYQERKGRSRSRSVRRTTGQKESGAQRSGYNGPAKRERDGSGSPRR
jgi:hypothetical protein